MSVSTYTPDNTKILHTTYADFVLRQICRPIHVVQYDDSLPILAVKLFSNGQPYTIPSNADVSIRLGKSDGKFVYNPVLGCNSARHIVYFEITYQMVILAEKVNPVIEVKIGTSTVASSSIGIIIDRNPIQKKDIESTSEWKTIQSAIDYAKEAISSAASAQASMSAAKISEMNAKTSEQKAQTVVNQLKNYIKYAYPRIQNIRISFSDRNSDFIFAHKEILIPEETVFWGTPICGPSGVYEKSTDGKCIEYIKIFSGGGAEAGITITGITLTMIRPDRTEAEEYSFTPTELTVKGDKADISYGDGTCRIECSGPYQGAYIYLPCIANISYEEMKALYQLIDSEELDQEIRKSINEIN